jgi:hypothetical protein
MIFSKLRRWLKEKPVNKLILIRISLLVFNLTLFFAAVVYAYVKFKGNI